MVGDTGRIVELRRVAEIHKTDALISYFSNEDLCLLLGRIAELESALKPIAEAVGKESEARKAEYLDTDDISAFGYPPVLLGWLRHAATVLASADARVGEKPNGQ